MATTDEFRSGWCAPHVRTAGSWVDAAPTTRPTKPPDACIARAKVWHDSHGCRDPKFRYSTSNRPYRFVAAFN
jgi:hypothetical protein